MARRIYRPTVYNISNIGRPDLGRIIHGDSITICGAVTLMINDRLHRFADSFAMFVRRPPNPFTSHGGSEGKYLPTF